MATAVLVLVVGLGILAWGASHFVDGSASAARHLGVPPLLIGMVIIGFGTSLPELAVSTLSASQGQPDLALGNAFGSNIANMALILGLSALLMPLTMNSRALRGETAVLAAVTALSALLALDGKVSRPDAWILLGALAAATLRNVRTGLRIRRDELARETAERLQQGRMPLGRSLFWTAVGLVAVLGGSRLIVRGATEIARSMGLGELVIGLTIVAVGTSLPELAAAVSAVWKREDDLVLGNVLGSNLINTTAVVAVAAAIRPLAVAPEVLARDLPVMGGLTLFLVAMTFLVPGKGRIGRSMGVTLVLVYAGYVLLLLKTTG